MKADRWARSARASLPTTFACTCDGAGARCLVCETESETELGCDDRLDATRTMPAPVRTPEYQSYHARVGRWLAGAGMLVWLFLIALLKTCGARSLTS